MKIKLLLYVSMFLQPMVVQTAESVQTTEYYETEADENGKSVVCVEWAEQDLRALMQRQPVKDDGLLVEDDEQAEGVQQLCLQAAESNTPSLEAVENIQDTIGPRLFAALMTPLQVAQTKPNAAQQRAHSLITKKKRQNKDWDPDFRVRWSRRGGPFTCNQCGAISTDRGNLQRHKRRMHGGLQPRYTCPEGCSVKLWDNGMYLAHMRTHKKK